jgi:hypothetical protein
MSTKGARADASARRRSVWILTLLTAVAVVLAIIRIGPRFSRGVPEVDAAIGSWGAERPGPCAMEVVRASRREWSPVVHRDPFRWEDVFQQPIPPTSPALQELEREAREKIRLQAVMLGSVPRALINGELRREGDVVANFRILRIEQRRIIVEKNGVHVELTL